MSDQAQILELMRTAPPEAKSRMRKFARRKMSECLKLMGKAHSPEQRAYLAGWLDYTRRALEALQ
jgi:hypothetical protein